MICSKCDSQMEAMGYGDERCMNCGQTSYSESEDEFNLRIYGTTFKEDGVSDEQQN